MKATMCGSLELAGSLQAYVLPDDIMPLAPRKPFERFSISALQKASQLSLCYPEKRGTFSHTVRHICGVKGIAVPESTVTIEAHIDLVAIPDDLADKLLELGFEPDGFASFVPPHFREHFTLKYKVDIRDIELRRKLLADGEERCRMLEDTLARDWPRVEAYVETEIYTDHNRRYWTHARMKPGWRESLPYREAAFKTAFPPTTLKEAASSGLPLDMVKRADIHAKMSRDNDTSDRKSLIESLEAIGFYSLITWAGNDICTAQFVSTRDARAVFRAFCRYFDEYGGCAEITLESVTSVWRSSRHVGANRGISLSTMPPVVIPFLQPSSR